MRTTIPLVDWTLYRNGAKEGEAVRVPHDAMLGEPRSADAVTGPAGAYFPGGSYRYERTLEVPHAWAGKVVTLELEGVYQKATVLLDGKELARNAYGYTGFAVDLTDHLTPGVPTTLTVLADNSHQPNSRWYSGSGIYRPAWLHVQEADHIALGGVRLETLSTSPARVRVATEVAGEGEVTVTLSLSGEKVAEAKGADVTLDVPEAQLWSAESPTLYDCRVALSRAGEVLDETALSVGIRELAWGGFGLRVNGEETLLRGGCVHHTQGILGAAEPPEAAWREVALLKSYGFNAIRSAHNPISRAMLDACDHLGIYVMDEFADMWYRHKNPADYASDFEDCWEADLAVMVAKDQPHPSVILYSIGNENAEPAEGRGVDTAWMLARRTRELDPTRPVTAGVNPTILFATGLGIDSFNADGEEGVSSANAGGGTAAGGSARGEAGIGAGDETSGAKTGNAATVDTTSSTAAAVTGATGVTASSTPTEPTETNASLAYNTYVSKMGDVMELISRTPMVGRANAPFFDRLDIAGYNYATGRALADLRRAPVRPVFGSETMPYDLAKNWCHVERVPQMVGDFMWTAIDYLGECSLAGWSDDPEMVNKPFPWLCADTGALDLIGNPNGEAAMASVVWGVADPLLYVRPCTLPDPVKAPWRGTNSIPSWSWAGCEGVRTTVEVYTQAPVAKLYLNGRFVAAKRVKHGHADFRLPYQPGRLEALACTADGAVLGHVELESATGPLSLQLTREARHAPGEDGPGTVVYVGVCVVDAAGVVEASFDAEVSVEVEGGELIAFGSAAQKSERSYLEGTFPLRHGRALAIIRLGDGPCTLTATTPTLSPATLTLV